MPFQRPVRERVERIRLFRGIAGLPEQVLYRQTNQGNSSPTIANEIYDLSLTEKGALVLRDGFKKITSYNDDVTSIFFVKLGGRNIYGVLSAGEIDLLTAPARLELEELPYEDLPTDFPVTFITRYRRADDLDDIPLDDPAMPPGEQVCPTSYTWTGSPNAVSFVMPFGGPAPSEQSWFWELLGWKDTTSTGTFNADPSWLNSSFGYWWYKLQGPCVGALTQQLILEVDSSATALVPDDYTFDKVLTINDGTTLTCSIGLHVGAPAMLLAGDTTIAWGDVSEGSSPTNKTIQISNSSVDPYVTTILRWTATVTGDAALVSVITLSTTSGTNNQGEAATSITVSADTSALGQASYSATITFSGESGSGVADQTVPISITIVPAVPASCPYGTPPTFQISGIDYNTFLLTGNTMTYNGGCVWETVGATGQPKADIILKTDLSGTFLWWNWPGGFEYKNYSDILTAADLPCWLLSISGSNLGSWHVVGLYANKTSATPAGTYPEIWRNPTAFFTLTGTGTVVQA